MNGIMFSIQAFSVVMEIATLWWLSSFILERKNYSNLMTMLILVVIGGCDLMVTLFAPSKPMLLLGSIMMLGAVPFFLFKRHMLLKLFTLIMFIVVVAGAEIAVKAFLTFLHGTIEQLNQEATLNYIRGTLLSKFLALIGVRLLSSFKKVHQHILPTKFLAMLIMFPVATVLVFSQLMNASYFLDQPIAYIEAFFAACTLIMANIMVFYVFEQQAESEQVKHKLILMQNNQQEQAEFYRRLAEEKKVTNKMAHDLKHTMLSLSGHLQNGNISKVLAYIEEMQVTLQTAICHILGNVVVDTVLSEKQQRAVKQKTELKITSKVYADIMLDEMDLAILLANALDNALEATASIPNAKIELTITIDQNYLDLIISNTINHVIQIKDNTVATTKLDKERHGIGLSSIEEIVKRYQGHMTIATNESKFILDLMIQNKKQAK